MVLALVLVVVALLTLAAGAFAELMLAERKAAVLSARQAQARALAESGVEMARLFVLQEKELQDQLGGWYDNAQQFQMRSVTGEDLAGDFGRFTIVAPRVDYGIAEGIRYGLEDESTRLNLNALISFEEDAAGTGREILMGLPGMTEYIADAILDWMDEDDNTREFGAEADYYSGLESSYVPKNGPLETVEELLLVRDVTPWLLFGCDANHNGSIDPDEPDSLSLQGVDNSDGSMNRGWAAYLTLYGLEANLNSDGQPKINLNQNDMEKLHEQLEEAVDNESATFIVAYRQNGPYSGNQPGVTFSSGELDLTKQGTATLKSVLDLIGSKVEVTFKGAGQATVLESPFPDEPGQMDTYLPTLVDQVTVTSSSVISGRININQAPRTVLETIPGMTPDIVDKIIAGREPNPTEQSYRADETWILSGELITLEEMKALMPFVTGGGSVYRAQVIGYFNRGGPAARIETVIDATASPARLVFWRDMSHLGRGYALETLGIGSDVAASY